MTINACVSFTINEGTNEQFEAAFADTRAAFLADDGCLRYDLQKVCGSSVDYVLLEAYDSQEAIERHNANPNIRSLGRALKGSLLSGPHVVIMEPAGDQVPLSADADDPIG
jgi:quinol monooxygenase YgiN